jgi:hypothetical protein
VLDSSVNSYLKEHHTRYPFPDPFSPVKPTSYDFMIGSRDDDNDYDDYTGARFTNV